MMRMHSVGDVTQSPASRNIVESDKTSYLRAVNVRA